MESPAKSVEFRAVKVGELYYIQDVRALTTYAYTATVDRFLFDGVKAESTFHPGWMKIQTRPTTVQEVYPERTESGDTWILRSPELESEKIPLRLTKEQLQWDGDYYNGEYAEVGSLYTRERVTIPAHLVDVPFTFTVLMEVEAFDPPAQFSYKVDRGQWKSDGVLYITNKDVRHQELDVIVFPSLLLSGRPAMLTSEQVYKIVRKHIQENIDPKVAHITSDYNFCFTVEKRVKLAKSYITRRDVSRGKKPKYVDIRIDTRDVKCFEMTHERENYKGYTPIRGITAANETELKEKMDTFLEELMEYINEPLCECPTCNGRGMLFDASGRPELK